MIRMRAAVALGAFGLDVDFEGDAGVLALFGRSGAGKSITIALIAGLMAPDNGFIEVAGRVLVDTKRGIFVPKYRRQIGLVYQDARLFPHLTVRQNLLFGRWFAARAQRAAGAQAKQLVDFDAVVATLGIAHLLRRRPGKLSGGERQRVAIGRALLSSPSLLLMDEPLAALDDARKLEVLALIERLRDEFHVPIVYVSHAIEEVARLASRVVVLENGRVVAAGAVDEVFTPARSQQDENRFARSSVLIGHVAGQRADYGLTEITHPAGTIWIATAADEAPGSRPSAQPRGTVGGLAPANAMGREVRIVVRATDVTLATAPPQNLSVRTVLTGNVAAIESDGGPLATIMVNLRGHGQLMAMATRMALDELALKPGDQVYALIKTVALDERSVAGG